jgi:hypothetical protein
MSESPRSATREMSVCENERSSAGRTVVNALVTWSDRSEATRIATWCEIDWAATIQGSIKSVIPAKAGIQIFDVNMNARTTPKNLDSRFRGNDREYTTLFGKFIYFIAYTRMPLDIKWLTLRTALNTSLLMRLRGTAWLGVSAPHFLSISISISP